MNEYNKYNYDNNYTTPLNIVNFNNYLKKLVIPKKKCLCKDNILKTNINDSTPIRMPTLIPRIKRNHCLKNLHDSDDEREILEFQKLDNEIVNVNIVVEVNSIIHLLELIEKYEINPKFNF